MIKLLLKKIEGEFVVQWVENGVYSESKTYYTDCKEDAVATMEAMKQHKSFNN